MAETETIVRSNTNSSQLSMLGEISDTPQQGDYKLPEDMAVSEFDKVYITYDYSRFRMIETNRNLNEKNRAKILKSCRKKQLCRPINVFEKDNQLYIVDGQHRFSVWKELSQPIYFIVNPGYSETEMKEMNLAGVLWNKATYLESYVKAKKEPYLVFKELMDKTNFSIDLLLSIFKEFQNVYMDELDEMFREGNLTLDKIEQIEEFLFFHKTFVDYPHYKKANFVKALMKIYENEDVDREHLIAQYEKHRRKLDTKYKGTIKQYIETIMNDVYSIQAPKSKAIYYNIKKGRFHK